ncbi:MAG TPA: hypothetical protein VL899_12550 [Alphaproteobacteria bacterium]|nr:hypothetical protein [Alphaproteobacteria bacterium]
MNARRHWIWCLPLLAGLPVAASTFPAAAATGPCTPVVYAFRHAEDMNVQVGSPCLPESSVQCYTTLTVHGKQHADMYLEMVTAIGARDNFCPVRVVYAVNPINPNGAGGTTNPYKTGAPLSRAVSPDRNPYVTVLDKRLDQNFKDASPTEFHAILVSLAKANISTAVFWTSEGLHNLGLALGSPIIPDKAKGNTPPRNAAYVFRYKGDETFAAPVKADEYVQCFNFTNNGNPGDDFGTKFYCGTASNGNLEVPESQFENLHGRICNTLVAGFKKTPDLPGYSGFCE